MYPAYIVHGKEKNLMIDAGINLYGPLYLKTIETVLSGPDKLDYLFVTHSHYDHLGAAPYLKRKLPGLKFGGAQKISDLFQKDSVLARMNKLSDFQRETYKDIVGNENVVIEPVTLDIPLKEGDKIDLGSMTCEVHETPGHTNDSISFFIPEQKILFPGEALGLPNDREKEKPHVIFLSSSDDYIRSIERLKALKSRTICFGHGWVLTGDDASDYFSFALDYTVEYIRLIKSYLKRADGNVDEAIKAMAHEQYDATGAIAQERNAYITNLTAQVKHIAGLDHRFGPHQIPKQ